MQKVGDIMVDESVCGILEAAAWMGLEIEVRGDMLAVTPKGKCLPEFAAMIVAFKPDIIELNKKRCLRVISRKLGTIMWWCTDQRTRQYLICSGAREDFVRIVDDDCFDTLVNLCKRQ